MPLITTPPPASQELSSLWSPELLDLGKRLQGHAALMAAFNQAGLPHLAAGQLRHAPSIGYAEGGGDAGAADLLVSSTISRRTPEPNTITHQLLALPVEYGSFFEVYKRDLRFALPQRLRVYEQPSPRGEIQAFSPRSQSRLRHLVLNTEVRLCSMLSLTYHNQEPDGPQTKRDLSALLKAIRRLNPDMEYIWVLEFQTRGKPHFHILLNITAPSAKIRTRIARAWHRITGEKDMAHLRVHQHRKSWIPWEVRNFDYLSATYLSKDAQKTVPEGFDPGRFWGASAGIKPRPLIVTAETIAQWANEHRTDQQEQWTTAGITAYFKKCLKLWHVRRCAKHRRKSPLTFARPGTVNLNLGNRVFQQLVSWVCANGPPIHQPVEVPF